MPATLGAAIVLAQGVAHAPRESGVSELELHRMGAWDHSLIEAEQGVPIVWGWALRRMLGAGLCCAIGIMHSYMAANDAARTTIDIRSGARWLESAFVGDAAPQGHHWFAQREPMPALGGALRITA